MTTPTVSTDHAGLADRLATAVTFDHICHPDGSPMVRSDEPQTIALAQVYATLALVDAVERQGQAHAELLAEISARLDELADNTTTTGQDIADRLDAVAQVLDPGPGPVRRWLAARRPFRMILT